MTLIKAASLDSLIYEIRSSSMNIPFGVPRSGGMSETGMRSGKKSVFATALLPSTMLEGAAAGGSGPHPLIVRA